MSHKSRRKAPDWTDVILLTAAVAEIIRTAVELIP